MINILVLPIKLTIVINLSEIRGHFKRLFYEIRGNSSENILQKFKEHFRESFGISM